MNMFLRPSRVILVVAGVAIVIAALVADRGRGDPPAPGAELTAGAAFTLGGTVANLAPGITSSLVVTATNSFSVPITLNSLTVSMPSAPAGCPSSNLTINGTSFAGGPPSVTVGGLSQAVPASGSANVSLPILVGKSAGNGCQSVTFPFSYTGSATYTEPTTTTLSSAPDPSTFGQSVTFTATVAGNITPSSAAVTPVGAVTFYSCSNPPSCTTRSAISPAETVNGSGQGTFSTSTLNLGAHTVLAVFTATDPTSFGASTSNAVSQTVNQAPTTTVLASAPDPSIFGQSVNLTTTVSSAGTPPTPPTGAVSFYLGSPTGTHTLLGSSNVNAAGQATFTASSLPGGADTLYAVYAGDGNFLGSTSGTITQQVNFTGACIVTTINGTLTVQRGQAVCINSPGRVNGTVTVQAGGSLATNGANLNGGLVATGATALRICSSTISGTSTISASTGFVLIGDAGDDGPPGCGANTLKTPTFTISNNTAGFEFGANKVTGSVSISGNTGAGPTAEDSAPEVEGNTISGALSCPSSNNPPVVDGGQKNKVSGGGSGQCAGKNF